MAKLVQQSTANDPLFFFLVQSSDHITALTGASPTVTISKNGAAFASPSGAVTEIANGWYQVAGNATDTNTLGDLLLHATAASGDPCDMVAAQVVAFNPRNANLGLSNVSSNVAQWNGTNVSAPATAGIPDVNVKNYNNVVATTDANNLPKVDVEDWKATAAVATNTAGVPVVDTRQLVRQGTAQGTGDSTTAIKLDSGASATDGFYKGMLCQIISGTGAPEIGVIIAYVGATKIATITPAWPTAPDATSVFQIFPAMTDLESIVEVAVSTSTAQLGVNTVNIAGQAAALDANNLLKVDVEDWKAGVVPAVNVTGVPKVDVVDWLGAAPATLSGTFVQVDTEQWKGGTIPAANVTGVPKVDMVDILGTAVSTPATAGILDVNVKNIVNAAAAIDSNNLLKVDAEDWKGGVIPAVNVTGVPKVDVADWLGSAPNALTSGKVDTTPDLVRTGTAQAGGNTTITLDSGASATNNFYQNQVVRILSGTGAGQTNTISSYVGSTKVATCIATWATNPDNTSVFAIYSSQGPISATVSGNVTVGGYAAGQDPFTLIMASAMTESYTTGAFTLPQALYEIAQVVGQFSITGTTLTFQKRDKTTAGGTFTLNDATNPTSRTRAT